MAADTIREYLEHGTVRYSVNFPNVKLEARDSASIRVTVVNKNIPGMLSKITEVFARAGLNISQQINQSKGAIAYNVIDIDPATDERVDLTVLQSEVTMLDGVLSSRILFGMPGAGYARNIAGSYHV